MTTGFSLHIGINQVDPNHYDGWEGHLKACENDACDMKKLAEKVGYKAEKLLTPHATRKNVTSAIKKVAKKSNPGDIFFLSYSGHGGQVTDIDGDESDGKDETWCLFDAQLLDDEIFYLYAAFPSDVRIIVLSDSCHSGSVIRAGSVRSMPANRSVAVYLKNKSFYDSLQTGVKPPKVKATVQLISGCQDDQYALDGDVNGLFTETLLQVWGNGSFKGDYRSIHREISNRMPPDQSPNHYSYGSNFEDFESESPFQI